MATAKLTHELRNAIIKKSMKDFRAADKAEIEARRVAFGIELYEHEYGAVEAAALSMPEVWRDMTETYTLECEGFQTRRVTTHVLDGTRGLSGDPENLRDEMRLGRQRPFPVLHFSSTKIKVGKDHKLFKKARKLVQDHIKIVHAETELRDKMWALLMTCKTVKQLEAAWPEALQFLPKNVIMTTALVPVGLSDQINKALGIPSVASVATEAVRKAAKL